MRFVAHWSSVLAGWPTVAQFIRCRRRNGPLVVPGSFVLRSASSSSAFSAARCERCLCHDRSTSTNNAMDAPVLMMAQAMGECSTPTAAAQARNWKYSNATAALVISSKVMKAQMFLRRSFT